MFDYSHYQHCSKIVAIYGPLNSNSLNSKAHKSLQFCYNVDNDYNYREELVESFISESNGGISEFIAALNRRY